MHVPAQTAEQLISQMGCRQDTFPQVYLGHPLSNTKVRLAAFAPLIAEVDRYLARWRAMLLSYAGRLVHLNTVLDGLPGHICDGCHEPMTLPPGVIQALMPDDKRFCVQALARPLVPSA